MKTAIEMEIEELYEKLGLVDDDNASEYTNDDQTQYQYEYDYNKRWDSSFFSISNRY